MKKIITFLTLATSLSIVVHSYTGPEDERMPPGVNGTYASLGTLTQIMGVAAVADVFEIAEPDPNMDNIQLKDGWLKVRVTHAIYGCTNNQEILIRKQDPSTNIYGVKLEIPNEYDPLFEYYPTNHSRIVFVGVSSDTRRVIRWTAKDWKLPPLPEIIISTSTNKPCFLPGVFTRSWWYEDYQDGLLTTHFTNLVHAARVEHNWTNYYHIVRDAVPTPASPRIWQDSFWDVWQLMSSATQSQFDFMLNDPLFPNELRESQNNLGPRSLKDDD